MADMLELISKMSDTHLIDSLSTLDSNNSNLARKIVYYFEFADVCEYSLCVDRTCDHCRSNQSIASIHSHSPLPAAFALSSPAAASSTSSSSSSSINSSLTSSSSIAGVANLNEDHHNHHHHHHHHHSTSSSLFSSPSLTSLQTSKSTSSAAGLSDDSSQARLRLHVLLDLYVIGNSRLGEQGALQLLRTCDRLFSGFLQRMNRLMQLLNWFPEAQLNPLRPLDQALDTLHSFDSIREPDDCLSSLSSLDAQQLFSYMFSLLLALLWPIEEHNWTAFLRDSCVKFNNCLRLSWNESQFAAICRLLRPPFVRLQQYRQLLCVRGSPFEHELLRSIEHNAFANGLLKEMCYHFLSMRRLNPL